MTREQALQAARDQYQRGELDDDQYALEVEGIEYAHGEMQEALSKGAA